VRPNPNLPRGVQAFLFEAAERRRRVEDAVVATLLAAGLREVILPVLDYAAPYEGVTAEGDERLYRFMDREGQLLSLRADFTPMAARLLAPRLAGMGSVALFYRGDVVRDEEAGVGRPREFAQIGAERYGEAGQESDAATLRLLLRCLSLVPAASLRVTLGYAELLPRLLASAAPSLVRGKGQALTRVMAWVRERRVTAVEAALAEAGASDGVAAEIAGALLVGFDPASRLFSPPALAGAAQELARALALVAEASPGLEAVVDLAGTPEAPYYTGLTFRVDGLDAKGAVASGGRYDRLLSRFGAAAPAVGFSIGVEALSVCAAPGGAAEIASAKSGVSNAAPDGAAEIASAKAPATRSADRLAKAVPARTPLRIAVGKGRLLAPALAALRSAGIELPEQDGRRLLLTDAAGAHELLLLKDDDVPTYVAQGGAHLGVTGSDRVAESGEEVFTPVELPFGVCRLSLIGRQGEPFRPDGSPVRVGTKYTRCAERAFAERGLPCEIVPLAGSVELAAALRLTDVVVDLIETGATMSANGLVELETLMESRATLIVGPRALMTRRAEVAALVNRLRAAMRDGVSASC